MKCKQSIREIEYSNTLTMKFRLNRWIMFNRVLLVTFFLFITIFHLNGQFEKKTYMVGGEFNLPVKLISDDAQRHISLNAQFSYFLIGQLSMGINLVSDLYSFEGNKRIEIGAGPLFRYYFNLNKFQPFIHFSFLGTSVTFNNTDANEFISNLQPGIGLGYLILPSVGIEALYAYNFTHTNDSFNENPNSHYSSFNIGFQIFITPKKK